MYLFTGIVSNFLGHPMGPVKVIKQVINAMTAKQKTALDIHSQEKICFWINGFTKISVVHITYRKIYVDKTSNSSQNILGTVKL